MKKTKRILTVLFLAALALSTLCVPAFALTESEVEAQVAASGKEAVTGNMLIWFLCAVAFLKVSQKIDSFMATLGVNVGRTGGSLLAEAMIAMRTVTMVMGGGHGGRAGSAAGSAAGKPGSSGMAGFFKGGLVGMAGRHITNSAVRTATSQTSAVHTAQNQVQQAAASCTSAAQTAADAHINSEVHTGGSTIHTENSTPVGVPPQAGVIQTGIEAGPQAAAMASAPPVTSMPSGTPPQEGVILTGSEPPASAPIPGQTPQTVNMPPVSPAFEGIPPQEGTILTGNEAPATMPPDAPASQPIDPPPERIPADGLPPQEGVILTGGASTVHAPQTENVFVGGAEGTAHVENTAVAGNGQHTQAHTERTQTSHTSASSERVQTSRFLAGAGARPTLGGMVFSRSLAAGGSFANDVIGTVARGEVAGSITGDMAAQSLSSYMGYASPGIGSREAPVYSDVEIGRGRITGVETKAGTSEGLSFAMYHVDQYTAPAGEYTRVVSADGTHLYHILCRQESSERPFEERAKQVVAEYLTAGRPVDNIPVNEFYSPSHIDLSHGRHICIDGVYYAYLLVPSGGYKAQVPAGWLSLLVNAGDGIDLDMFLTRQPKDRMIRKLGQQLRINRSKIKETSDTNTDFDDLDGAIRSGYLLKDGLSNNEDFYYLNLLVTITAANVEDLEWKCAEMKKLLLSQDMDVQPCSFCQEQAFLSSLPLVALEKHLFERSKRNVLTLGAASCYPFTSYEMCDDNGILLGVNKHNNSLIIVDIFDSRVYKNANIAILGTSGAGKSFTMQLMATRMRRKGIQVFIVAPLKGHEFHRACSNIGGEFIQISPASKNCINVMEIRKVDKSVDELLDGPGVEKSLLAAKIQRLHIFFSLLIPDMTHEERQLLDDALIRTYAKLGITHENSTLDDPDRPGQYRTMPVLGDLYEVLKESQDTRRLANIINRLVHGSARTFNQQTNVSLDNKYTVLDISELTGDLLTVGMFVALDYVWDKAKENRTEEKAIFIDECWQLIGANSNRLAAEFVLEIFKIIRGYGGSAICATQDINDFFALEDGKYGKGIINNAKTKILLNLEDEEARRVQSLLHLSEAEVMEITHFERGSGLISTNNNNVTVEIKCSQMEKELITTDRRELQELLNKSAAQPSAPAD